MATLTTRDQMLDWAFGPPVPSAEQYRQTGLFNVAGILLLRLMHPADTYRTDDPSEADLFVMPLVPHGPPYMAHSDEQQAEVRPLRDPSLTPRAARLPALPRATERRGETLRLLYASTQPDVPQTPRAPPHPSCMLS